jgi:hypothetical protein
MEACSHPYLPEKGPPHSLNRRLVLFRGRSGQLGGGKNLLSLLDRITICEPGSPADYVIPACKNFTQGSQKMLMIRINYIRRNQTSFTGKCVRTFHEIQEGVRLCAGNKY